MTKIILRRKGLTFVPVGDESLEALFNIKDGAEVIATVRGARNIEQLKLFWALVGIVSESCDVPKETIKRDLAISLGYTETWVDHDGGVHIEPQSIAVESMTQDTFNEFFHRAVNLMAAWINAEHKDLMRRFNELAADKRYEGARHE